MSLPERIQALAASPRPSDQFLAYQLAAACVFQEQDARLAAALPADAEAVRQALRASSGNEASDCKSLAPGLLASRFEHLDRALAAGVPGAPLAFATEGPWGDLSALETRGDDPLVLAWKERAIRQLEACAEAGDPECLGALSVSHANGALTDRDPAKALVYETALFELKRATRGVNQRDEVVLNRFARGLSAAAIQQAQQDGKALYLRCCARMK